jgi:hypothetical protein
MLASAIFAFVLGVGIVLMVHRVEAARDANGTYTLFQPGNPVQTRTIISSSWANNTLADIAQALTESVWTDGGTIAGDLVVAGNGGASQGDLTVAGNATIDQNMTVLGQFTGSLIQGNTITSTGGLNGATVDATTVTANNIVMKSSGTGKNALTINQGGVFYNLSDGGCCQSAVIDMDGGFNGSSVLVGGGTGIVANKIALSGSGALATLQTWVGGSVSCSPGAMDAGGVYDCPGFSDGGGNMANGSDCFVTPPTKPTVPFISFCQVGGNNCSVRIINPTAGVISPPNGDYRCRVFSE